MRRQKRDRRALGERPVHVGQREPNPALIEALDRHAAERVAVWSDVAPVLQQLDRVDDIVSGDGLPVLPSRVVANLERPHAAVALGAEPSGEIRHDRPVLVVPRESAEREPDHVLVDVGRGDDGIEVLRHAGNAFDVGAAICRTTSGRVLFRDDGGEARQDEQPDEGDDDDLVATGHLPGGSLRAPQRDGDEQDDEDDRQAEERPLEPAAATVCGRFPTESRRETGAAGLKQDRGRDRDGDDELADLKWIHRRKSNGQRGS